MVPDALEALPTSRREIADLLARSQVAMYDAAGLVDEQDVTALLRRIEGFERLVREWLRRQHPDLV
jgi:hypothetical protein